VFDPMCWAKWSIVQCSETTLLFFTALESGLMFERHLMYSFVFPPKRFRFQMTFTRGRRVRLVGSPSRRVDRVDVEVGTAVRR
jgi:hypothetical protein